ncbi:DNA polymerase delta subunit 4-like [Mya arenaria]|uniref:DNA polymerase delta subunit 4-like n=1 Tax=Mya arenaria TaxID=6604 RepID=UPI0022E50E38|nr:DNA polymerase delta subunit 4-like [Mya arenaria]
MSSKNRLITSSYRTTKQSGSERKFANDVKPSTSKDQFEQDMVVLKEFDLNWEYGPSMGITRLERWNRAEKHGLNPSPRVRQIVEAHSEDEQYVQCLWNDYKNLI